LKKKNQPNTKLKAIPQFVTLLAHLGCICTAKLHFSYISYEQLFVQKYFDLFIHLE